MLVLKILRVKETAEREGYRHVKDIHVWLDVSWKALHLQESVWMRAKPCPGPREDPVLDSLSGVIACVALALPSHSPIQVRVLRNTGRLITAGPDNEEPSKQSDTVVTVDGKESGGEGLAPRMLLPPPPVATGDFEWMDSAAREAVAENARAAAEEAAGMAEARAMELAAAERDVCFFGDRPLHVRQRMQRRSSGEAMGIGRSTEVGRGKGFEGGIVLELCALTVVCCMCLGVRGCWAWATSARARDGPWRCAGVDSGGGVDWRPACPPFCETQRRLGNPTRRP